MYSSRVHILSECLQNFTFINVYDINIFHIQFCFKANHTTDICLCNPKLPPYLIKYSYYKNEADKSSSEICILCCLRIIPIMESL
jgi:hypothetical protein